MGWLHSRWVWVTQGFSATAEAVCECLRWRGFGVCAIAEAGAIAETTHLLFMTNIFNVRLKRRRREREKSW